MAEPMTRRERVARAIDQVDPDGPMKFNGEPDFSDYDECDREKYLRMADAAIAAADAGKPSKEEFGKALDKLIDATEDLIELEIRGTHVGHDAVKKEGAELCLRIDAARREVERLAGYGEEG